MPSHWPTDAQQEQWERLGNASKEAAEECADEEGKENLACRADVISEEAAIEDDDAEE